MKKIVYFMLLNLFFICTNAQEHIEKKYGNNNKEELCTIKSINGHYIAGGSSMKNSLYPIYRSISLIKMDSLGDTLFIRYFDGKIRGTITSIDEDKYGNIYCVTSLFPNYPANDNYRTVVTKHHPNGKMMWQKRFNQNIPTWSCEIVTLDNGVLVSGSRSDYEGAIDIFGICIDSSGNELWNKTYHKEGNEMLKSIELSDNGSVLLTGSKENNAFKNPYFIEIDLEGNKRYNATIPSMSNISEAFIHKTKDKGYIISTINYDTDSVQIYKLNDHFQYEWIISDVGLYKIFRPYEMQDGSFLVGAQSVEDEEILFKINSKGKFLKRSFISKYKKDIELDLTCITYEKNGNVTFGGTLDFFNSSKDDWYFTKINDVNISSESDCPTIAHSVDISSMMEGQIMLIDDIEGSNINSFTSTWYFWDSTTFYGDTIMKTLPPCTNDNLWAMLVTSTINGCKDTIMIDLCGEGMISDLTYPSPSMEDRQTDELEMYPNPFSESFTVKLPQGIKREGVSIINLLGDEQNFTYSILNNEMVIHTHEFPKGIYLLHIQGVGKSKIEKR